MKHKITIKTLAAYALVFAACASTSTGNVTGLSLTDAIEQTGEKIASELPKGSRVAIVAFESANDNISDYIMEELTGALFDRKIEVADRQNLEYVYQELKLQMSGDVSDESAKSIGKFLAADMVITGQLLDLDGIYRYRTSAINVETAVRASVTRLDVKSDTATRRMMTALANQKTTVKVAKYGVSADTTPQTAGAFLDRGIMFLNRGDYDMAISDFTEAIKLNPNMSAAYTWRGFTYYMEKDYDRSIADHSQAIRLNPNDAKEYGIRGNVYLRKSDYDRAFSDFNQAIQIDPNDGKNYIARGVAYTTKGDYDKAIADHSQAIRLNPNDAQAYTCRATAYGYKNDYNRVIEDASQAIRLDPNDGLPYNQRGDAYYSKKDYDRAIADYSYIIQQYPNRQYPTYVYNKRGMSYFFKADYARAITDFEATLRIDPNDSSAKQWLDAARKTLGR